MVAYLELVNQLRSEFEKYKVIQAPRELNTYTDMFVNLDSSTELSLKKTIPASFLESPCIDNSALIDLFDIDSDNTFMTPIICYIQHGELTTDKQQARKLKIHSARYSIIGDKLYKHSFSGPYLRCLRPE